MQQNIKSRLIIMFRNQMLACQLSRDDEIIFIDVHYV